MEDIIPVDGTHLQDDGQVVVSGPTAPPDSTLDLDQFIINQAAMPSQPVNIVQIGSDWQMDYLIPGVFAEGADAIIQSMFIILTSAKGSQPFNPDFGSGAREIIDRPIPEAEARLRTEIISDLRRWEPRANFSAVRTARTDSYGRLGGRFAGLLIEIAWAPKSDATATQVTSFLASQGGAGGSVGESQLFLILSTENGLALLTEQGQTIEIEQ